MAKTKKLQDLTNVATTDAAAPDAVPESAPVEAAATPDEAPAPDAAAASSYAPARFRVLETKRVSYFGQMIMLHAGDVLDESGYTPAGIARLQECGVKLEKVAQGA